MRSVLVTKLTYTPDFHCPATLAIHFHSSAHPLAAFTHGVELSVSLTNFEYPNLLNALPLILSLILT
jgi:hypothetical protein